MAVLRQSRKGCDAGVWNLITTAMNSELREFFEDFAKKTTFANREHVSEFWARAEVCLAKFPVRYAWTVSKEFPPKWVSDTKSLNTWYWSDLVGRIEAINFLYAAKARDLLRTLEYAICSNSVYLAALSLRAFIEVVASLKFSEDFIKRHLEKVDIRTFESANCVNKDLEDELIKMTHGSKFNWQAYLHGDFDTLIRSPNEVPEEWAQTNIMTRIDKLVKQKRYASIRLMYGLLCEYVHPNFGNNLIYIRKEEENEAEVKMHLGVPTCRVDMIEFLEPFTGVLLSCCEITSQCLTQLVESIAEIKHWSQLNYALYSRSGKENWGN